MALLTAMSAKRKLPRVSSRVPFAFKDRVDDVKTILQRKRRWFYDGEKLSEEGIVAVALLEFMALDEQAQAAALDRHLPTMDAMFKEVREMKEETPIGEATGSLKGVGPGLNYPQPPGRTVKPPGTPGPSEAHPKGGRKGRRSG